jgi:putative transposase
MGALPGTSGRSSSATSLVSVLRRTVIQRAGGKHGTLDLHGWAFDRFTTMLTYKAEAEGIEVDPVSERDTSKSCSVYGTKDDNQRVERGLYVCGECGLVANADANGAENIRQKSTSESPSGDRSNGWMAQPGVRRFDATEGAFLP